MLVEVLHEDGELPVGVPQLAGHRLPLEDQGANLDEVLVALHALVVPGMNAIRENIMVDVQKVLS